MWQDLLRRTVIAAAAPLRGACLSCEMLRGGKQYDKEQCGQGRRAGRRAEAVMGRRRGIGKAVPLWRRARAGTAELMHTAST
jgi:hypothetical protein